MTLAAAMYTAFERADTVATAASKMLSSRAGEVDTIFIVGLIAVAVGLGCLVYGLRAEWRRTRIRYRDRRV